MTEQNKKIIAVIILIPVFPVIIIYMILKSIAWALEELERKKK